MALVDLPRRLTSILLLLLLSADSLSVNFTEHCNSHLRMSQCHATDSFTIYSDVYLWADATGNMRVRVSAFFPLEIWPNIVVCNFLLLLCLILTHASSSMCTIPYSSSECSDIICSSTAIYFGAILRWGSQVNKINVGMQSYVRQNGCSVSQWLRVGGVKAFADGSLGSRTALFHEVLIIFCTHFQLLN